MDIVYASLTRRRAVQEPLSGEVPRIVETLWAHATAEDGLEYASGRAEPDRVDLLLYLLTPGMPSEGSERRAGTLLIRCHQASRQLQQDYLPPRPTP